MLNETWLKFNITKKRNNLKNTKVQNTPIPTKSWLVKAQKGNHSI